MPEFAIRQATLADVDDIAKLHFEVWGQTYQGMVLQSALDQLTLERRRAEWREILAKPSNTWVAQSGAQTVGFMKYGAEDGQGTVQYLYIDPAFQGQGIGKTLMQKALALLFAANCKSVELAVVNGNDAAAAFYKSIGASERDEMRTEGNFWRSENRIFYWQPSD